MPKPVCFPCQRFFRMKKMGFYFIEGMPVGGVFPTPGKDHPEDWKPYKVWVGDKWECEGCGAAILTGFGANPIALQHEEDFKAIVESLGADKYQVNDC